MDLGTWWVETVRVGHEWVPNGVLLGGDTAAAGEERTWGHIWMRYPLVEPWTARWRCQKKCQVPKDRWGCEQNAGRFETDGGKDPEALD